jgi:glutamate racemase
VLNNRPIGIFDSGLGGLTIFNAIIKQLPGYDYIYLGDNARAPYGNKSFNQIYHYTLECVRQLFDMGCPLVILACNTASAKALRTIQQKDLISVAPDNRVLGVIRPTAEVIGNYTLSREIGILGTKGTVNSGSYVKEIENFYADVKVFQQACPLWVPLIENGEHLSPGADYFVKLYLDQLMEQSPNIDTILLGCTHYPLLMDKIQSVLPGSIQVISQADIIAHSLVDYLQRHPEMDERLTRNTGRAFFTTTDDTADFDYQGSLFFTEPIISQAITVTR